MSRILGFFVAATMLLAATHSLAAEQFIFFCRAVENAESSTSEGKTESVTILVKGMMKSKSGAT